MPDTAFCPYCNRDVDITACEDIGPGDIYPDAVETLHRMSHSLGDAIHTWEIHGARPELTPADTLTPADLPTLRRMAKHYQARAAHRGFVGATVCRALAAICDRAARVITKHGEMRPEVDY